MSYKNEWFLAGVEPEDCEHGFWVEDEYGDIWHTLNPGFFNRGVANRWCYATPPPLPEPEPDPEFQEGELVWATFLEEVSTSWTKQKVIRLCLYSRRLQKSCKFCRRPIDAELRDMGLMRIKEAE